MRYAIALLLAASLSAFAAGPKPESQMEKDQRECDKQGEAAGNEAVKKTPLQSPADVTFVKEKAKQTEISRCMRAAGHASGPIRAK